MTTKNTPENLAPLELLEHFVSTPAEEMDQYTIRAIQIAVSNLLPEFQNGMIPDVNEAFDIAPLDNSKKYNSWIRNYEIATEIRDAINNGQSRKTAEYDAAEKWNLSYDTVRKDIYGQMLKFEDSLKMKGINSEALTINRVEKQ